MTPLRILRASVFSAALCAVLATRVVVGFDSFRAKLLRAPAVPVNGIARIEIDRSENSRVLEPPFAVIARIQNDSPDSQTFAIVMDDRGTCTRVVPSGRSPHRIDCVWDGDWNPDAIHHITFAAGTSTWNVSYLEIATHHGATRAYNLIVVPAASRHFDRTTPAAVAAAFVVIALFFLLPSFPMGPTMTILHRTASATTGVLLLLVFASPYASPYAVLLSRAAFWESVALLAAPRLWRGARWAWSRSERVLSNQFVTSALVGTVVLAAYAAVFSHSLSGLYHGNYSGFLQLSRTTFDRNPLLGGRDEIRRSLDLRDGGGYDGQFMYFMTFDPFLRQYREHPTTYDQFVDAPPYRFGRIGFSLLTKLFSADRWPLYPATMMWLILAGLFSCGALLAAIARLSGASPLWGLLIILFPGFWGSLQTGLPEPIAGALLLGGYLSLRRERFRWAGLLLALSLLVRETGAILVLALIAGVFISGKRREGLALGLIALTPVFLWRLYVGWILFPGWGRQAFWFDAHAFGVPLVGIVDLWSTIRRGDYFRGIPDFARSGILYSIGLLFGLAIALAGALKTFNTIALAAVIYGLLAISLAYGSVWVHVLNAQRATYELFVCLALISVGMRGYTRTVRVGLSLFWVAAAAYVFFGAFDADYVRNAVFAAVL